MVLFIPAEESAPFLIEELRRGWPEAEARETAGGLVESGVDLENCAAPVLIAFARQTLLHAEEHRIESINSWANLLFDAVTRRLPENQPWRLHVAPHFGEGRAGENRCRLIRAALVESLRKKRRGLLRALDEDQAPLGPGDSLAQLLLTEPGRGFLSLAAAPLPHRLRAIVSPFPKGHIPAAVDKAAPARAFGKLLEAEQRLGCEIAAGETCVDLGASPGSWTYVALQRGARVTAVDRSPLRDDLMRHPGLTFVQGDAFKFRPEQRVDWLLCDVIAEPHRSIELVQHWLRERLCRNFVVTIKFKGAGDYARLDELKESLPGLTSEVRLTRLCANKNEVTVFGSGVG